MLRLLPQRTVRALAAAPRRTLLTAAIAPARTLRSNSAAWSSMQKQMPMHAIKPNQFAAQQLRTMFIQTDTTPNQDSLKFMPGVAVMKDGSTAEFLDARNAMGSPLAKKLFQIDGVRGVFFGPDFVTITKDQDAVWQLMKPDVYSAIMDFFASGQPIISEGSEGDAIHSDTMIHEDDSETVQMIKELLDTRIRPSIQDDGGDIEYRGFEDGVVKLKLKGACRTCDSSTVTLKNGIENMLMHYVPEVTAVEQAFDEEDEVSQLEFEKLERRLMNQ
ncbi:NFU1 iron-sulfur cluster scaffold homolog, mitochondrial [Entomortierella parvispora]|uniref:NFU1 iron-sulfur cluster scaffold homolog, mitochondrial n=1 Tax=Entomortierella parvispora TaxID=205924 RepID=A0A9P3H6D8_9FUNG|nr:NFU1 iron-sulfur cluster scaffold homolog, mitochondrial [Entomortierella parvispora]